MSIHVERHEAAMRLRTLSFSASVVLAVVALVAALDWSSDRAAGETGEPEFVQASSRCVGVGDLNEACVGRVARDAGHPVGWVPLGGDVVAANLTIAGPEVSQVALVDLHQVFVTSRDGACDLPGSRSTGVAGRAGSTPVLERASSNHRRYTACVRRGGAEVSVEVVAIEPGEARAIRVVDVVIDRMRVTAPSAA